MAPVKYEYRRILTRRCAATVSGCSRGPRMHCLRVAARVAVDEGLVQGRSALSLSKVYALGERAIGRHKQAHLSPALTAVAAQRDERRARGLVERLEDLIAKIEDLVDTSHDSGSAGQMLAAARELRACWELQAKLTGELNERPQVAFNLIGSPEVGQLVTVLLRALAPFPEARIAAADALDTIDVEVGA